jgi:hypothetical protein
MSDALPLPELVDENNSVIVGRHPVRASLPILVAPTDSTRAAAFNTVRRPFVTVACTSLKERNFKFDSSFIGFEADGKQGIANFASMVKAFPKSPVSIFGHADPTGDLHYNQVLSGRRAKAVFALLTRNVKFWEELYDPAKRGLAIGDVWGVRAVQAMLRELAFRAEPEDDDGTLDATTRKELAAFQSASIPLPTGGSLPILSPADGSNDPQTRLKLYMAYMNAICKDASGADFRLPTSAFLRDGKSPGAFQGCGEFNPRRLPSQARKQEFKDAGKVLGEQLRNAFHKENRRVLLYLFKPDTVFDEKEWPCPAATGDTSACEKRLWSNGLARREGTFKNHARRFGKSVPNVLRVLEPPTNPAFADELGREETTFGCRFYHGLALHSPCERDLRMWIVRLQIDAPSILRPGAPATSTPKVDLANRRFVATMGTTRDAPTIRGRTSAQGRIGLPLFEDTTRIDLRVDAYGDPNKTPKDPDDLETQPFTDEGLFVPMTLLGGAFPRTRASEAGDFDFDEEFAVDDPPDADEQERAGLQRLHNLGYGTGTPGARFENWTPGQRTFIITAFQRDHKDRVKVTGVLDLATKLLLRQEYGS